MHIDRRTPGCNPLVCTITLLHDQRMRVQTSHTQGDQLLLDASVVSAVEFDEAAPGSLRRVCETAFAGGVAAAFEP